MCCLENVENEIIRYCQEATYILVSTSLENIAQKLSISDAAKALLLKVFFHETTNESSATFQRKLQILENDSTDDHNGYQGYTIHYALTSAISINITILHYFGCIHLVDLLILSIRKHYEISQHLSFLNDDSVSFHYYLQMGTLPSHIYCIIDGIQISSSSRHRSAGFIFLLLPYRLVFILYHPHF